MSVQDNSRLPPPTSTSSWRALPSLPQPKPSSESSELASNPLHLGYLGQPRGALNISRGLRSLWESLPTCRAAATSGSRRESVPCHWQQQAFSLAWSHESWSRRACWTSELSWPFQLCLPCHIFFLESQLFISLPHHPLIIDKNKAVNIYYTLTMT